MSEIIELELNGVEQLARITQTHHFDGAGKNKWSLEEEGKKL